MAVARFTSFSAAGAISSGAVRVNAIVVKTPTDGPTSDTFLELFNTTSGAVILGTTAPDVSVVVEKLSRRGTKGVQKFVFPNGGRRFQTACALGVVTGFNGATGATTTAPDSVEVFYTPES